MKSPSSFFITLLLFILWILPSIAQEVTILVDKRGFPRKKDCYAKIALSDSLGQPNPTTKAYNSPRDLYFTLTSEGDWQLDSKFFDESVSYFTVTQGVNNFKIIYRRPVTENSRIVRIVFALSRFIDVTAPFDFNIPVDGINQNATMKIPEILWPNYEKYQLQFKSAQTSAETGNIRKAFEDLNALLQSSDLAKYSFTPQIVEFRVKAYSDYFQKIVDQFNTIQIDQALSLKQRQANLSELITPYTILLDSLVIGNLAGSNEIELVKQTVEEKYQTLLNYLTNLAADIDKSNIIWLETAVPTDHRFRFMVECLYALARTQNLNQPWNSAAALPDSMYKRLENFQMRETYNSLTNVMKRNLAENKTLIPPLININLSAMMGTFKQPVITVIYMVAFYYQNQLDSSLYYLKAALQKSSDMALNEWLAEIDTGIKVKNANVSPEIKKLSDEGMALLSSGSFDGAAQKFQSADYIQPNSSLISYDYALLNLVKKDTLRAITYFERAISFDSTMTSIYRRLYNLYITQKDWNKASNALISALSVENTWEFNYFLAYCYMQMGDYYKAIGQIDAALLLNAKNYDQYILQGDAYKALSEFGRAREKYDQAKFLEPDRNEAYERLRILE